MSPRPRVGYPEDPAHHQADDAGSVEAITKQLMLSLNLAQSKVHLHAVEQTQWKFLFDSMLGDQLRQPNRSVMHRLLTLINPLNVLAQDGEPCRRLCAARRRVHGIVAPSAPRVQLLNILSNVGRQ